ncbi:MAG: hypothetical protein QW228_03830 [Candidatus Aenigmatarchaeota archaeon]
MMSSKFRIFLIISIALNILSSIALAQIQSHPLSEITPIDVNLDMFQKNITNVSYLGIGLTSPLHPLDVAGSGRISNNLYIGTAGRYLYDTGSAIGLSSGLSLGGNLNLNSFSLIAGNWINASNFNVSNVICLGGICKSSWPVSLVGGSGTPGYIPLWTASDSLGNSVIYQLNNLIGIGSTSPSYLLEVGKTASGRDVNLSSTLYVNGTAGNVGIGTTNPTAKLEVVGETKSTSGFYLNKKTITLTTAPKWLRFAQSASSGGNNAGIFEIRWTRAGIHGHIIFSAGANFNDPNGINLNLLGGSSYSYQGITQIRLLRNTTYDIMYLEFYTAYGDATYPMTIEVRQLSGYGWNLIDIVDGSIPTGYTAHTLNVSNAFAVNEDGKTFTVTKAGNVGIGTTVPIKKLDVVGDINATSYIYVGDAGRYFYDDGSRLATSGNLRIGGSSQLYDSGGVLRLTLGDPTIVANNLRIGGNNIQDSGGNNRITLGDTTIITASLLDLSGNLEVSGNNIRDSAGTTRITLGDPVVIGGTLKINDNDIQDWGGTVRLTLGSTVEIPSGTSFNVDSGTLYVDAANDRVGIGTISPQAKLDVEGSIKADNFQTDVLSKIVPIYIRGTGLNNNANRVLKIGSTTIYDTTGRGLRFTVINKADYSIAYDATFDTYGYGSESDNLANNITMRMNKNTIGILTSYDAWENAVTTNLKNAFKACGLYKALMTPTGARRPYAAIFECNTTIGTAKAVEVMFSTDANAPFAEIRGWLIDGSFVVTGDVPNALANNIGTTPVVMVNEAGNVGIGTTSPSSKLEVYGGDIEINDGAATGSYKIKGLRMFYAGDETNVSTTSTTYVLIKKLTAVLNETYGIKPSYINVLARLGGSATTYMNISLPGCVPSTQISGSGAGVLAKASIAVSGCTAEIQPIEVYLKTTSGTGWNDIIEFYYVM